MHVHHDHCEERRQQNLGLRVLQSPCNRLQHRIVVDHVKQVKDVEDLLPKESEVGESNVEELVDKVGILDNEDQRGEENLESDEGIAVVVVAILVFEDVVIWAEFEDLLAFLLQ